LLPVTSPPRRILLAVAGIALAALAVTSCRPVHTGAAAVVGPDSIGINAVQDQVTQVLAAADDQTTSTLTGKEAELQRQVLTRLIDGLILEAAARSAGVAVTDGEIDAQQAVLLQQAGGEDQLRQQALQSGIAPRDLRSVVRQLTLNSKLAAAVVSDVTVSQSQLVAEYRKNIAEFDQVHAAHILVPGKALADRLLAQVRANPDSFADLAKQNSIDTNSKENGGDLGSNGKAAFDPTFGNAVFAAKPGSLILVKTSFGYHVVHIISHDTKSLAQATPQLRAAVLKTESDKRLGDLLTRVMRNLHISVNPRYGYWDVTNRAVAPPRDVDRLAKPEPTPTPAATGQPIVPGQQQPPAQQPPAQQPPPSG
jgi:parvulin-like peptidyl-prolyl isomerase